MQRNDSLHGRLKNWARFVRLAPDRAATCTSIEGNFRIPDCPDDPPQTNRPQPPNAEDAWEIELAARCIALKYHFALWLVYVLQYDPHEVSKAFRMSKLPRAERRVGRRDVAAVTASAQALLARQLEFPAVVRKERAARWVREQLPRVVESGIEVVK